MQLGAPAMAQPYSPPVAGGGPGTWDIGGVLSASFEMFKQNWVVLVFAPLVGMLIAVVPSYAIIFLGAILGQAANSSVLGLLMSLLGMVVMLALFPFFMVGILRIFVKSARGETPQFGEIFGGASRFLPLLGATLLLGIMVELGFALLIVPGVFLACGLWMTPFLVVDQNMGPIDAMKASWAATDGQKMQMFLFGLVAFLIVLAGELACGVGLFVAYPLVYGAAAIIYTRLAPRVTAGSPA
jgi:uncharacterized membrane protein